MIRRFYSEPITTLRPDQIFVFGSNLAGIHGAGAAKQARSEFGAEQGVGEGPTGQCYALPTKDLGIQTRRIEDVKRSVALFIYYATQHPELEFLITPIGCGLAGFKPQQIAPMFANAPYNCVLPTVFK